MAKMYPQTLPKSYDISYAEQTLFQAMKMQLNNSFNVYHSFHWSEARNTSREIDFIILHPDKGFLVLEVKGGLISIHNDQWFSENKNGVHKINDPFNQARRNMFLLLDFFEKRTDSSFPGIASYGVCFPDSKYVPDYMHPAMTQENILFNHHLDEIEDWINRLYENTYSKGNKSMNPKIMQEFHNMLKPSLQIPLSIRSALRQQQKELKQIDFFQDYILDIFEDKNRVAIQGSAGTGKTWIAMKKVKKLIEQGKNCLFLCYNSLLSQYLKNLATKDIEKIEGEKGQLDIYTFHAFSNHIFEDYIESTISQNDKQKNLFFELIKKLFPNNDINSVNGFIRVLSSNPDFKDNVVRRVLQEGKDLDIRIINLLDALLTESTGYESTGYEEGYFNFNVPMALLTLLEDNSYLVEKYDAIIIDEGQDFKKTWCDCLAHFLENKRKRIVYIFYDDNQNIFMKRKHLPIIDLISKYNVNPYLYKLRKNIRNTKSIYDYASAKTDLGKTANALNVEGIKPYVFKVESAIGVRKEVGKIVTDLINGHQIENGDIVVLTDCSISKSVFKENKEIGNFRLIEKGKGTSRNFIRLYSIRRFKGLESDIIILVLHASDMELENRNELLYVGYTRAKFLLYVVELTM